ncbi:hypothetical protein CPC16_000958 [Podila verticillata]|nr:hypothetical protein BGZ59_011551 [Podila verticillata]KAF9374989.1 hypothetical protein CPC16_000958 [Podila verticillata]
MNKHNSGMKSLSLSALACSTAFLALLSASPTDSKSAFYESLDKHNNFIIANGWGPDRWGCSFTRTQVHESSAGTKITIGKDSALKPYSCGELIYRQDKLGYGHYTIDMIASNIVGQVTSFFLIANGDTEIDIELTGLNNKIGWMNIWHDQKQNPVSIDLPFDTSKDWHTYSFEWRKEFVAWSVDGKVVLNRSDIATTSPENANYKLAINSWTQVQPEINIDWAGRFTYPENGEIPQAKFRNMRYQPKLDGPSQDEKHRRDEEEKEKQDEAERVKKQQEAEQQERDRKAAEEQAQREKEAETQRQAQSKQGAHKNSAPETLSPKSSVAIVATSGSALLGVALAFTVLF